MELIIALFFLIIILVFFLNREKKLKLQLLEKEQEIKAINNAYDTMFDNGLHGVIIWSDSFYVKNINSLTLEMTGYNRDDIIDKHITDFISPYDYDLIQQSIKEQSSVPFEIKITIDSNMELLVYMVGTQIIQNNTISYITFMIDLTELNTKEEELQKLNFTLEERIKQEVRNNREKDQKMLQQSRLAQMGEMISMIAHQWRQPLTAISATTNNLTFKLMLDDVDKEFFKTEIALISEYTQHLSKTIDDFKDFFKDNKLKETTDLTSIINETLYIIEASIKNKNIEIFTDLQCEEKIETFPSEIKQVLLNLLKNAEDALIEKEVAIPKILVKTETIDNNTLRISVQDNGKGIPLNIIDKLFEPYFSTKKEKDGTGLGLYMSKTIIEKHCGGKISAKNKDDGALFIIELYKDAL